MNLEDAFYTLEFKNSEISSLNMSLLKKKYHKMALLHHPDKNENSVSSTEKFQKIGDAFEVIKRELSLDDCDSINIDGVNENINSQYPSNYADILKLFLTNVLLNEKVGEFVSSVLKDILTGCKEVSLKLFQDLDKDKCIAVYDFMLKYKTILHLKDELIDKVREIILEKYKNVEIIILNPSIDDLLSHNIYKLLYKERMYYVPLWHHELYYEDTNGDEVIVKCIPELPENIEIDEDNQLFVKHAVPFCYSLLEDKSIIISLGKFNYNISLETLQMKKTQYHILKKCGISRIREKSIYNIDKLSDIVVKIEFL